ncbi:MAG TPA: class I SAM-dependent methyltransferase [Usitatibacter sp.]|nr:class I SAM-dependent methyltransferase [Usitatibacter sp.]
MLDKTPASPPLKRAPITSLAQYWSDETGRRRFVGQLFDRTARHYDFVERLLGLGSGHWYRRQALRRAGLLRGMRVLDIATGTGLVAREALGIVGAEGSVIGLDPSARMLDEAGRLNIPLVRALGEGLPFRDAAFDFVSMGFALRHVADLSALFAEIWRVLPPGGTACVLEITRPRRNSLATALRVFMTRVVPGVATLWGRRAQAAQLMQFYWDTIEACVPPAVVLGALDRAGFDSSRHELMLEMFSAYFAKK